MMATKIEKIESERCSSALNSNFYIPRRLFWAQQRNMNTMMIMTMIIYARHDSKLLYFFFLLHLLTFTSYCSSCRQLNWWNTGGRVRLVKFFFIKMHHIAFIVNETFRRRQIGLKHSEEQNEKIQKSRANHLEISMSDYLHIKFMTNSMNDALNDRSSPPNINDVVDSTGHHQNATLWNCSIQLSFLSLSPFSLSIDKTVDAKTLTSIMLSHC